ncbi:LysE family translocator [Agaribacterium haliotis]|uniref:LysE family translocator n=1 Tax=Agaribacterium haliotis TaxID=2013869 RepID=UPI000BB59599|nr:LysE family translocator [Agaribacterium haliotis]
MDTSTIISFIFLAALLVVSPGPNGLLVLKTVASSGKKNGFLNILGFVVAFFFHGTLSILGIAALLVQSSMFFSIIKIVGALYLCWLGVKSLLSIYKVDQALPSHLCKGKNTSGQAAFLEGFITNLLNPKVSLFYLAAFPQFISTELSLLSAYLLVLLHSLVNVLWFSAMVLFTYKFVELSKERFAYWIKGLKGLTGITFIAFAVKMVSVRQA